MKTYQARFEAKFEKGGGDDCWEWSASKDWGGYGQFRFEGRMQGAHRVSYQLYIGEITDNLHVLHRCDNPACVNPSHLFLGTNADNMHDRDNKGRGVHPILSGEKHWKAKLTEEQVKTIRAMWADGVRGVDLVRLFRVANQTISKIVLGHTWAKIDRG